MQVTRQRIVDLLRKNGQATVEALSEAVGLTQMAVRHHLNVLQAEDLIQVAHTKRLHKPGRPVQVYSLTDKARQFYPQEYCRLADLMADEMTAHVGVGGVIKIFDGMADRLLSDAPILPDTLSFEDRLDHVTSFLREKGYIVDWEIQDGNYVVYHLDCPYRQFAQNHQEVCALDKKLIGNLLQVNPTRISCIAKNDDKCTYVVAEVGISVNQVTA